MKNKMLELRRFHDSIDGEHTYSALLDLKEDETPRLIGFCMEETKGMPVIGDYMLTFDKHDNIIFYDCGDYVFCHKDFVGHVAHAYSLDSKLVPMIGVSDAGKKLYKELYPIISLKNVTISITDYI